VIRKPAPVDVRAVALAAVALAWVVLARALLRFSARPVAEQGRLLARVAARLPAWPSCDVPLAAWAISAVARRVSGTRCLAWSLALGGVLAQMRITSRLRIGVATFAGQFDAHAWVECDGVDWSWGEAVERYGVLRPAGIAGDALPLRASV